MTDSTMVERVARAICNRRMPKPAYDSDAFDNLKSWAEQDAPFFEESKAELNELYADARAAIEAMMEPTEEMHIEGIRVMLSDMQPDEDGIRPPPSVLSIFSAMLRSSLKGEGE